MTIISPLQILPLHVVRMIVDHVVGSSRLAHDKVTDGFEGHKALLLPLLSVCRNFRAAAVLRYCIICTLRLTPTSDLGGEKLCYWPTHLEQDDFPTHLYTQELNIDLDMEDVCRGTALESLSRRPFSGCTFPKAGTLTVSLLPISTMIYPAYRSPAPETIEKNISALIQRIAIMVPVAKRAIIVVTPNSPDLPKTTLGDMYLCNFVKQLCLLVDSVEYDVYCKPVFIEQQPTGICDMVHMDMNREDHSELVMQLARRNASSLQSLMINFSGIEEITPLIVSADGIQVQYPRLSKLRLAQTCLLNLTQRPSFPDVVVPFPGLKSLTLGDSFFGDDTPFRGNAAKLEFLDLGISPLTVEILKQHRIFTPTSHPKLVCVKVVRNESLAQDIFRTEVEFMRYILSIGPSASVRVVPNQLQASKLPTIIPMFGDCACIQVLELPHTPLDLWNVLALVKALPHLCDLLTSLPNVRSRPPGVSEKQLFAYVCNNYAPVGTKLRRWRINGGHGADIENAVKCVLLLALACPNFDYAAVDPDLRDLFMAHIKLAITKDGFRKRAPRLRRLLFGGWSNEFFSVHVAQTNATMTDSEQPEYEDEW